MNDSNLHPFQQKFSHIRTTLAIQLFMVGKISASPVEIESGTARSAELCIIINTDRIPYCYLWVTFQTS